MSFQLLCLHTKFCQNPPLTASSLNNDKPWGLVLHQHFNFLMKNWPSFFLACEHPNQYHSCLVIQQKEITAPATAIWLCLPVLDAILTWAAQAVCAAPPSPLQRQVSSSQIDCKGDVIWTHWLGGCRDVYVIQTGVEKIIAFLLHPLFLVKMARERGNWQALNVHYMHLAASQSKVWSCSEASVFGPGTCLSRENQ